MSIASTTTPLWSKTQRSTAPSHQAAQTQDRTPDQTPASERTTSSNTSATDARLAGQIDLVRLIDLCSEKLGVALEYDPAQLKGTTTLRSRGAMSDGELWALLNQQLVSRGFTTVRSPGASHLSVVRLDQAAGAARIEPLPDDPGATREEFPAGFQSVFFRPELASAKDLAESVKPLLSKPGGSAIEIGTLAPSAGAGGVSSAVLVSDIAPRLDQIRSLMQHLDVGLRPARVGEFTPANLSANTLVALATQMNQRQHAAGGAKPRGEIAVAPSGASVIVFAPPGETEYWSSLLSSLDKPQAVETLTYRPKIYSAEQVAGLIEKTIGPPDEPGSTPAAALGVSAWRLVVDDLTGSLIITASPPDHEKISALVERLDSQAPPAMPARAFRMKNRPVEDIVSTLNNLLLTGVFEHGFPTDARAQVSRSASQRNPHDISPVTGPLRTGTAPLLPRAGPTSAATPPSDEQGPQGESPADEPASRTMLRLTADPATNTLIAVGQPAALAQLEALLPMLDVRQPQVMIDVMLVSLTDAESRNLGVEIEKLARDGRSAVRLASLFGLSTGSAAGRTVGDGAGLTGVVINPGEFSLVLRAIESLNTGRTQSSPRLLVTNNESATFSSVLQQPYVAAVSSSGGTAQGFGGTEDAGTTISVKPQIAQGDHLNLTYSIKLSSFVGTSAGPGLPPPKQQNSIDSAASIPDGHTVVVGGLELLSTADAETRVPGLGSIPIVGNLFKNQTKSNSVSRFYVFLRSTILRNEGFEDLRYVSDQQSTAARVDDGFPEVEPLVLK